MYQVLKSYFEFYENEYIFENSFPEATIEITDDRLYYSSVSNNSVEINKVETDHDDLEYEVELKFHASLESIRKGALISKIIFLTREQTIRQTIIA